MWLRALMVTSLLCSAIASSAVRERVLYSDVSPVNTSSCLDKIERVPLRHFVFKLDSKQNRLQLGVIGDELTAQIPDAVDVIPSRSFPNPEKGKPPILLENLALVDKNTLFMYNLGAVQELLKRQTLVEEKLDEIKQLREEHLSKFNMVKDKLAQELDLEEKEKAKLAEIELKMAKASADLDLARLEEEKKTIELQHEQDVQYLEYIEERSRQRMEAEDVSERQRIAEAISKREASEKLKEDLRAKRDIEIRDKELEQASHIEEKRRAAEFERVKEEARLKAEAARKNEDLVLGRIKAQAEEDRKRVIATMNIIFQKVGEGLSGLFSKPHRLFLLVAAIIVLTAGYYFVREASSLMRQLIESKIGKPKLVRETSRRTWALPFNRLRAHDSLMSRGEVIKFFQDVVLTPELQEQIYMLATSTRNARAYRAPYRHLLLHGAPGTGKTMVAKRLALSSGMDYALMSGGDVGPLGKEAVTELHNLFRWASKSPRGLLLFVDEAEAFLSTRGGHAISEERRNALNALLSQTGQQSYNFMMVLATNRPQDLDPAVLDRMDDALHFGLPDTRERVELLRLYYQTYIVSKDIKSKAPVQDSMFGSAAQLLEGFSGREISKLMLSVLNTVHGTAEGEFSPDLMLSVVKRKVREHQEKNRMYVG